MTATALRAGLVLLAVFLGVAEPAVGERDGDAAVCPTASASESSLRGLLDWCPSGAFLLSATPFLIRLVLRRMGMSTGLPLELVNERIFFSVREITSSLTKYIMSPTRLPVGMIHVLVAARDFPCRGNDMLCSSMVPGHAFLKYDKFFRLAFVEGDEVTLQKALNIVQANRNEYIAMLFYASWCPFSRACRPNFNALSFFFPTIRHFSFEESLIRPSILSGYGVHGFPTLFLLNSTMRVRYHGSRAVNSLIAFYSDISGIQPISRDPVLSLERFMKAPSVSKLKEDVEQENCPFSWARSPEKFLQQETYLALATAFLLSRFLYLLLPKVLACSKRAWGRHMRRARFISLWDCSQAHFEQAWRALTRRNIDTRTKRGNLREGAMNAKIWASKSLVSVAAIGEPSSSVRSHSGLDRR